MQISISNLRYVSADHSYIDMDVAGVFDGVTIPFTYHAHDGAPLTQAVKALLSEGDYEIAAFVG